MTDPSRTARPSTADENVLVKVANLTKHFPIKKGIVFSKTVGAVQAVDNVSFHIRRGETLGLVGESGCGKSTTGRLILRLIEPTAGSIMFEGDDLLALKPEALRLRRAEMQIIFQDPFGSLNPRMSVEELIAEPMLIHGIKPAAERARRVVRLMSLVGLASYHARRYPHEFSGGQRQRIGIARALSLRPKFLVCDEAVSALDVSIQAQIINLLKDLQRELDLAYLFISHGLGAIKHISDRVAVMYLGHIVEIGMTDEIYTRPMHPYTQALLSAIPVANPHITPKRILLSGDVPTPLNPPSGCRFHTRCPVARKICNKAVPELIDHSPNRQVACHLVSPGQTDAPYIFDRDGADKNNQEINP